jgi:hypothetical protein
MICCFLLSHLLTRWMGQCKTAQNDTPVLEHLLYGKDRSTSLAVSTSIAACCTGPKNTWNKIVPTESTSCSFTCHVRRPNQNPRRPLHHIRSTITPWTALLQVFDMPRLGYMAIFCFSLFVQGASAAPIDPAPDNPPDTNSKRSVIVVILVVIAILFVTVLLYISQRWTRAVPEEIFMPLTAYASVMSMVATKGSDQIPVYG